MGCGKSTVGRSLAKLLGMQFIDMDKYIEKKAGLKVSDIFAMHGEDYFRALESKAAIELSRQQNLVVGTGGGAVMSDDNVKAFKSGGKLVFIDVPEDIIKKRLEADKTRPLLAGNNKDEKLHALYTKRITRYRAVSDITVCNYDDRSSEQIAEEIQKKLNK